MKLTLALILSAMAATCLAQLPRNLSVQQKYIDGVSGRRVPVKEYSVAPYHISGYNTNADSNLLYLYLDDNSSNKHHIACVDIVRDTLVYLNTIKGEIADVVGFRQYITRYDGKITDVYNTTTGKKAWSVKGVLSTNDALHVGIAADGVGYDMRTGAALWDAKIDKRFGWGDVMTPDTHSMLVAAGALQYIDLRNGNGWRHELITGSKDYTAMVVTNVLGTAAAVLLGAGTYVTESDVVHGAHSAILETANGYALAGMEEVIHVAPDGNLLWRQSLPVPTGASTIWQQGDTLYILARGFAKRNGKAVTFGQGYLAAINIGDGTFYYTTPVEENNVIYDADQVDGDVVLVGSASFYRINLQSGKILAAYRFGKEEDYLQDYTEWKDAKHIYLKTSLAEGRTLSDIYPGQYFLQSRYGDILRLAANLKPAGTLAAKDVYHKMQLNNRLSAIYTGIKNSPVFIAKEDKQLMILEKIPNKVMGDKTISLTNDKIIIADLSSF
ncbi:MAG TPA: hypothetical protein VGD89_00670 [Flavipsychrobacter sp.]